MTHYGASTPIIPELPHAVKLVSYVHNYDTTLTGKLGEVMRQISLASHWVTFMREAARLSFAAFHLAFS